MGCEIKKKCLPVKSDLTTFWKNGRDEVDLLNNVPLKFLGRFFEKSQNLIPSLISERTFFEGGKNPFFKEHKHFSESLF
jgi:hypothetical protein